MTRLAQEDIRDMKSRLEQYDRELVEITGLNLLGIACYANNIDELEKLQPLMDIVKIGVVPIKSGMGIIPGFSDAIMNIVEHIGFDVFVTQGTDVAGIAEAVERKTDVIVMADDHRFIALNIRTGCMVDNTEATAKGYVAGLDLMSGGLSGEKVFIIGCGPVGCNAAMNVIRRGGDVAVFDIVPQYSLFLADRIKRLMNRSIVIEKSLKPALRHYHLIIDATHAVDIIDTDSISPLTCIAAPGMPLGLTPRAIEKIADRLIHDPIQIGVAVMVVEALQAMIGEPEQREPSRQC
jgi:pyrrolysine biosynthesis protein PylD